MAITNMELNRNKHSNWVIEQMDDKQKSFLPLHSSWHSLPPLRRNCTCLLKVDPGREKKHDWNYWFCSGCTDREIGYYRKQAQRLATCSWYITLCIGRCFYPNWLILIAIHFISNVFPGNQTHAEQEHTCWALIAQVVTQVRDLISHLHLPKMTTQSERKNCL